MASLNPAPSEAEAACKKLIKLLESIHPDLLRLPASPGDYEAREVARELRHILDGMRAFVCELYLPAADGVGARSFDSSDIEAVFSDLEGELCGSLLSAAERSRLWPDDGDDYAHDLAAAE